jgi:DNA-directed RNA polymerase sigma subunit (sigma70/sigma32)
MGTDTEEFMEALGELDRALDQTVDMARQMKDQIEHLRRATADGQPLREVVSAQQTPLIVQLLTESTNLLHTYGNRVRRTQALALHHQGMTMDEVAQLFGVTRQRVSALLRDS